MNIKTFSYSLLFHIALERKGKIKERCSYIPTKVIISSLNFQSDVNNQTSGYQALIDTTYYVFKTIFRVRFFSCLPHNIGLIFTTFQDRPSNILPPNLSQIKFTYKDLCIKSYLFES